jgi:Flp pilus assembly protein TadG
MIRLTRKLSSFRKENAQTMVEFALVFPFILLITYGIMEIGRAVFIKAAVTNATREGARYGAAVGYVTGDIKQYSDCTGIYNAVKKNAFLIAVTNANITITYDKGPGLGQVASSCEALQALVLAKNDPIKLGDRIVVKVKVWYSPVISFVGIKGFFVNAENGRTILTKVKVTQ